MKKWLIAAIAIVLVLLLALSVFLIIYFIGLAESTEPSADNEVEYEAVEEYVAKVWPNYESDYDSENQILTLSYETTMTYENACSYGGSVYTDELAPETYLDQVRSIAIDVIAHCGCRSLNVILQYTSSDGKPVFTVCSDGSIWTCWE